MSQLILANHKNPVDIADAWKGRIHFLNSPFFNKQVANASALGLGVAGNLQADVFSGAQYKRAIQNWSDESLTILVSGVSTTPVGLTEFKYAIATPYDGGILEPLVLRSSSVLQLTSYTPSNLQVNVDLPVAGIPLTYFAEVSAASVAGPNRVGYIHQNGNIVSNSGTLTLPSRKAFPIYVGSGANVTTPWRFWDSPIAWTAIFYGRLSDAEKISIARNPQQLFQPEKRIVYFDMGAGSSVFLDIQDMSQAQVQSSPLLAMDTPLQMPGGMAYCDFDGWPVYADEWYQNNGGPLTKQWCEGVGGVYHETSSWIHSHTIISVALTVSQTLSVSSLTQGQLASAVSLVQQSLLSIQDMSQAQVLAALDLTQQVLLSVHGLSQGQVLAQVSLLQQSLLSVQGMSQAQVLGVLNVIQQAVLVAASITQPQVLSTVSLTQQANLQVSGLAQGQLLSAPNLAQSISLILTGVTNAQLLSSPNVFQSGSVNPSAVDQSQAIATVNLTQSSIVAPSNVAQTQVMEVPSLSFEAMLALSSVSQAQLVSSIGLTQQGTLSLSDVSQLQTLDATLLSQDNILTVSGVLQHHLLGELSLTVQAVVSATAMVQPQSLDQLLLTQAGLLELTGILQQQSVGQADLVQHSILVVDDVLHSQIMSDLSLIDGIIAVSIGGDIVYVLNSKVPVFVLNSTSNILVRG
jgi:hypothetical protein